ncbi:MAG: hypothetical protein AAFY71_03220 [Bacteroidota bacterium]
MGALQTYGKQYQANQDYASLKQVVDKLPEGATKKDIISILGEPIDMGFDLRYLLDSTGQNGCVVGAVFHYDEKGVIDQKWLDEICE